MAPEASAASAASAAAAPRGGPRRPGRVFSPTPPEEFSSCACLPSRPILAARPVLPRQQGDVAMRQLFRPAMTWMTWMLSALPALGWMLGAPAWGAVTAGAPAPGVPSYQSYTPTQAQIDQGKIN